MAGHGVALPRIEQRRSLVSAPLAPGVIELGRVPG
ncbi:MAG: hypothetical protein QOG60_1766, partial [Frankiaceae bacterium]|nr:hypothetical protein [Frankiaceae bacterium]